MTEVCGYMFGGLRRGLRIWAMKISKYSLIEGIKTLKAAIITRWNGRGFPRKLHTRDRLTSVWNLFISVVLRLLLLGSDYLNNPHSIEQQNLLVKFWANCGHNNEVIGKVCLFSSEALKLGLTWVSLTLAGMSCPGDRRHRRSRRGKKRRWPRWQSTRSASAMGSDGTQQEVSPGRVEPQR